jgi:hypothetical protein
MCDLPSPVCLAVAAPSKAASLRRAYVSSYLRDASRGYGCSAEGLEQLLKRRAQACLDLRQRVGPQLCPRGSAAPAGLCCIAGCVWLATPHAKQPRCWPCLAAREGESVRGRAVVQLRQRVAEVLAARARRVPGGTHTHPQWAWLAAEALRGRATPRLSHPARCRQQKAALPRSLATPAPRGTGRLQTDGSTETRTAVSDGWQHSTARMAAQHGRVRRMAAQRHARPCQTDGSTARPCQTDGSTETRTAVSVRVAAQCEELSELAPRP